jgi:hypothetical protein
MFENINELINSARKTFDEIKIEYQNCLDAKKIDHSLLCKVRRLLADLRDPLDHIYLLVPGNEKKSHFPIANSKNDFDNRVKNISAKFTCIIEPYQEYYNQDPWLKRFSALSNIHKHMTLIPNIRRENKVTTVKETSGGSQVKYGSGVTFGSGVSICGVPIDPATQLPIPSDKIETSVTIWVDFQFDPYNKHLREKLGDNVCISVLPFLKDSLGKVEAIVSQLKSAITE